MTGRPIQEMLGQEAETVKTLERRSLEELQKEVLELRQCWSKKR